MSSGTTGGVSLDPADRILKGKAFARYFGFAQGRLHAAQLRNQRRARALVKGTPLLAGSTGVQSGDGAGYERVVISHPFPV